MLKFILSKDDLVFVCTVRLDQTNQDRGRSKSARVSRRGIVDAFIPTPTFLVRTFLQLAPDFLRNLN